jgi:hypothetical protein
MFKSNLILSTGCALFLLCAGPAFAAAKPDPVKFSKSVFPAGSVHGGMASSKMTKYGMLHCVRETSGRRCWW